MDGNGNIQINHFRKKSLQYRLIIKLNYNKLNYNMLIEIAKVIGVDEKKKIFNCVEIFEKYSPLTSRLICQLNFLKVCLKDTSVNNYLLNRNLNGFIEAKGCFLIRENGNHSFSIKMNDDYYLLNIIKNFFSVSVKIKNPSKTFYLLEIYKKETLNYIISHCKLYPLLGNKSKSLDIFIKNISK
ncbi:Dod COI i15 grp IB protein (mitochondrion) [Aspergillus oryzae 100-8]|uniref:Dod COI i15 grp IB protein n=1 Tax=Aspergillus oryzae (strain 3.042) TaxID=1160506 RepID=I6U4N8_ASPO3|nr:Dod COI i15 grp IB protein [Aspergillus oryzae 3.042]AFM82518.1 Dod COI i15 grp IB protein [Aspergillus oryzae 3.042]KDE74995.1 Dod COI i15 grp IB protein [Aspergillus oryzae 100-8]|eukprot:AFM82518.1 Dod COI i15 grp IB protein (mitochondrion) [Aspergillus oryzae 3.042]